MSNLNEPNGRFLRSLAVDKGITMPEAANLCVRIAMQVPSLAALAPVGAVVEKFDFGFPTTSANDSALVEARGLIDTLQDQIDALQAVAIVTDTTDTTTSDVEAEIAALRAEVAALQALLAETRKEKVGRAPRGDRAHRTTSDGAILTNITSLTIDGVVEPVRSWRNAYLRCAGLVIEAGKTADFPPSWFPSAPTKFTKDVRGQATSVNLGGPEAKQRIARMADVLGTSIVVNDAPVGERAPRPVRAARTPRPEVNVDLAANKITSLTIDGVVEPVRSWRNAYLRCAGLVIEAGKTADFPPSWFPSAPTKFTVEVGSTPVFANVNKAEVFRRILRIGDALPCDIRMKLEPDTAEAVVEA